MSDAAQLVPGRECRACTLCCKVMRVEELNKPKSQWCAHCAPGKGCQIYETRPFECRGFFCGYRQWKELGEHWDPAQSKMMVTPELNGARIAVHVDPGHPGAWRKEPYYSEIGKMAAAAVERSHHVMVVIGQRAIVIFPNNEIDLGHVGEDETVVTGIVRKDNGMIVRMFAEKRKKDDPEIAAKTPGPSVHRL